MADYLSEPTLAEVFPTTLVVNGNTCTLQGVENLYQGADLMFQWGVYTTSGDFWVIRFCKPDNAANPTEYLYDQIASTDADGMTTQNWALSCIVQCSTLWNE